MCFSEEAKNNTNNTLNIWFKAHVSILSGCRERKKESSEDLEQSNLGQQFSWKQKLRKQCLIIAVKGYWDDQYSFCPDDKAGGGGGGENSKHDTLQW